jgi:hypothetical protein
VRDPDILAAHPPSPGCGVAGRAVATTRASFLALPGGTASASQKPFMHATFFQKVIICAIAGFLAAALLEWGKMFVTGADDALNAGYKHTVPGGFKKKP